MKIKSDFKKTIGIIIIIIFFTIEKLCASGFLPVKDDSLHFEVLLNNKMLSEAHLDIKFIESLETTSNRLIMLSSVNKFYLLGRGGLKPVGQKVADTISSFVYTPDGFLMVIRNKEICYIDSTGNLAKLRKLPCRNMKISAGKNAMYLYDQNKDKEKYALCILAKGGKFDTLAVVHSPITSVVEMDKKILFSMDNALFSFDPKNKELKAIASLQQDKKIISATIDTSSNTIYLSTENALYAIKDSRLINLTGEFGGMLKYYINGLLVFDTRKSFLIRIIGIEDILASKTKTTTNNKQPTETLTNSSIISLVKEKLSDELIIKIINRSRADFNMSANAVIALTNQNVSSAVIEAMEKAMENNPNGQ
jgi:hypothetical protein